jgi:hypothetical protein
MHPRRRIAVQAAHEQAGNVRRAADAEIAAMKVRAAPRISRWS